MPYNVIDALVAAYEVHLNETFEHDNSNIEEYNAYIQKGVALLDEANRLGHNLTYVPRTFNEDLSENSGFVKAVPHCGTC